MLHMQEWNGVERLALNRAAGTRWALAAVLVLASGCARSGSEDSQVEIGTTSSRLTIAGSVQLVETGAGVEIRLTMEEDFPDSALVPMLFVGDQMFSRSKNPARGNANALIFSLSSEQFAQLDEAAPMTLRYGNPISGKVDPGAHRVWEFGPLNKAALEVL